MTTSELFVKHFGETCAVSMFHPNISNFFQELNELCLEEDRQKKVNSEQNVQESDTTEADETQTPDRKQRIIE